MFKKVVFRCLRKSRFNNIPHNEITLSHLKYGEKKQLRIVICRFSSRYCRRRETILFLILVITQKKAYNIQNTTKAWNQEYFILSS